MGKSPGFAVEIENRSVCALHFPRLDITVGMNSLQNDSVDLPAYRGTRRQCLSRQWRHSLQPPIDEVRDACRHQTLTSLLVADRLQFARPFDQCPQNLHDEKCVPLSLCF